LIVSVPNSFVHLRLSVLYLLSEYQAQTSLYSYFHPHETLASHEDNA